MDQTVKLGFEGTVHRIPIGQLLPLRTVSPHVLETVKYKRIACSIGEVGIIEPLAVAPQPGGRYLLLDGHLRLAAVAAAGGTEVPCLIATDDEAFTYNKRVNRLATIQETFMIERAVERGVPEDKIAAALNVEIALVRRRRTLLDGIAPEVVELLKDKNVNPITFDVLRKLRAIRQIDAAELMVAANNYTLSYAKALLAATRQNDLVHPDRPKQIKGMLPEQMAKMEREMESLSRDFKALEASFGDDVLHLVIASGYLTRLLSNAAVEAYLARSHPELLDEFRAIVAATSLDQAGALAA